MPEILREKTNLIIPISGFWVRDVETSTQASLLKIIQKHALLSQSIIGLKIVQVAQVIVK